MLMDKIQLILTTVTTTPTPVPDKDNGWLGKIIERGTVDVPKDAGIMGGWFGENFKEGLTEILSWLGNSLLDFLNPIVNWGGRLIIVGCFIIFYCSGERKYIAAAMKWAIICLLFWTIEGAFR